MPDLNKKADKITAIGVLQMFAGGALILLFTIIATIGGVWSLLTDASFLIPLILLILSLIAGGFTIRKGYSNYKLASRFRRISRALGEDTYSNLAALEEKLGWSRKKLVKALKKQNAAGFWPGLFYNTYDGTIVQGHDPSNLSTDTGNQSLDELLKSANTHIDDLSEVSRSLEDTEFKAQVETLTDISKQIYEYIEKNPDKAGVVRQLSNYLLPTTVSLLKTYQNLQEQTVKSDNMTEAMQEIKAMMITVTDAFKKQLGNLYSEKTTDVAVEIEVMQKMLGV